VKGASGGGHAAGRLHVGGTYKLPRVGNGTDFDDSVEPDSDPDGFYTAEFVRRIVDYYGTHDGFLAGHASRIRFVEERTLPELVRYVGPLDGLRVLDVGCGTASSTVALRDAGAQIDGFDVDGEAVSIGRARLAEHGFNDVVLHAGADLDAAGVPRGCFDLVYMNAVIEHVPSRHRARMLADAAARLRPGGHFVIAQSPNRWWPRDVYLTGLWLLPWMPAGSRMAALYASTCGRVKDSVPRTAAGARELERRGVPGITYRGVLKALPQGTRCVNCGPEHRTSSMATTVASRRRRTVERVVGTLITPMAKVPVAAFGPMFSLLVFCLPGGPPAV